MVSAPSWWAVWEITASRNRHAQIADHVARIARICHARTCSAITYVVKLPKITVFELPLEKKVLIFAFRWRFSGPDGEKQVPKREPKKGLRWRFGEAIICRILENGSYFGLVFYVAGKSRFCGVSRYRPEYKTG
jgi:hypothetical protein